MTLVLAESLTPSQTWMIGNSPKSDINPARLAGLNAVFLPNDNTWILEHDDIDVSDDGVLRLGRFPELLEHFRSGTSLSPLPVHQVCC